MHSCVIVPKWCLPYTEIKTTDKKRCAVNVLTHQGRDNMAVILPSKFIFSCMQSVALFIQILHNCISIGRIGHVPSLGQEGHGNGWPWWNPILTCPVCRRYEVVSNEQKWVNLLKIWLRDLTDYIYFNRIVVAVKCYENTRLLECQEGPCLQHATCTPDG